MPSVDADCVVNAMTIDVEDYFQVSAFDGRGVARRVGRDGEPRRARNTERLLAIFDEAGVRATFFVLGWVAERFPGTGAAHSRRADTNRVARLRASARSTTRRRRNFATTCAAPEQPSRTQRRAIVGYRAPSFSITERSLWALDVLVEEGYRYDASIYPIHHDRYGIPGWRRDPHVIARDAGIIWELPGSTVRMGA